MTYGGYLQLDQLLAAQTPLSSRRTTTRCCSSSSTRPASCGSSCMLHELDAALGARARRRARGRPSRSSRASKHIQRMLFEQWGVLETLTPSEYLRVPRRARAGERLPVLQYRRIEFLLGNKDADMLKLFAHDAEPHARAASALERAVALRRVPALPRAPRPRGARRRASSATSRSRYERAPGVLRGVPRDLRGARAATGTRTRCARSSSTSRSASSSGASAT